MGRPARKLIQKGQVASIFSPHLSKCFLLRPSSTSLILVMQLSLNLRTNTFRDGTKPVDLGMLIRQQTWSYFPSYPRKYSNQSEQCFLQRGTQQIFQASQVIPTQLCLVAQHIMNGDGCNLQKQVEGGFGQQATLHQSL